MSDSAKVRLVRCPKCENLLPELADYSVYQCGGCGAVLRAKKKNPESDTLSEKSEEERMVGASGKLDDFSEKGGTVPNKLDTNMSEKSIDNSSDASETDAKSNSSYSARAESRKVLRYHHDGVAPISPEKFGNYSRGTADKWVNDNNLDMKMSRTELGNASMGTEPEELKARIGNPGISQRSRQTSDWRIGERDEKERFRRSRIAEVDGGRFSTSNHTDEGPSNNYAGSSYGGYEKELKNHNDSDAANRVEYLEQDRAELLRKLDELKDQLSRSGNVAEKPKDKVPLDARMVHQESYADSGNWFPSGSASSNRASMQFYAPDKHAAKPPYYGQYPEPYPFGSRNEMAMQGFYPTMHTSHHIPNYGDPIRSQMLSRAPHQAPGQYQQHPSHPYFSGQYVDADLDQFEPYPAFHHPSCSCFHCYEKHRQVPVPVPATAFSNKRFPDVPNNPTFYNHKNPSSFGPQGYNARIPNPTPLNSHDPQPPMRWPSDVNSDLGGFVRPLPQRVVLANAGRHCRPVASGAPFVTCCNCFELLQLPKKLVVMEKSKQKMQCGACSVVLYCEFLDKKLVVSVYAEETKQTVTAASNSSDEVVKGDTLHSHDHVNQASGNFYSDDFDSSSYDFQSMDRAPVSSSTGQDFNSSKTQETHSHHSSSATSSEEDEDSRDVLIGRREVTNSVDLPKKATLSPPLPGSPLQDYFDYSTKYHRGLNRVGKGNRSSRADQEKVIPKKVTSRQNSIKDASAAATEMEVSFNEYSNTGVSHDSGDTSREDERPRFHKGSESFLAGIIKKSFRNNPTVENGKINVTVNGEPLPDRLIKKAEKLAGPIHPGQYWYDCRAGFWGVIGGPCLGIIPPYIEELNYPMPEDCAGGNTGVFVNGRELHQKDLELLSSRGLPNAKDRSYIVEISGRVLDKDTGEELDSLGKLAPTVEKVKHGFGMKAPRAAAAAAK